MNERQLIDLLYRDAVSDAQLAMLGQVLHSVLLVAVVYDLAFLAAQRRVVLAA